MGAGMAWTNFRKANLGKLDPTATTIDTNRFAEVQENRAHLKALFWRTVLLRRDFFSSLWMCFQRVTRSSNPKVGDMYIILDQMHKMKSRGKKNTDQESKRLFFVLY